MKGSRIFSAITVLVLILLIANYIAGFLIYREYKEKADFFDRQIRFARNRFIESQNELKNIYDRLQDIENSSRSERGAILSKIRTMERSIENWQNEYTAALSEIIGKNPDNNALRKVDLGEISVKE